MKRSLSAIPLLFLVMACAKHVPPATEILRLEDRREAARNFAPYLHDTDEQVRRRAAEALGKIQDPAALPYLIPLGDDPTANMRATAIFAIGQIGDTTVAGALEERLAKENDETVTHHLLAALGKIGTRASLPTVAEYLHHPWPELRAESALALARLAARRLRNAAATAMLETALLDTAEAVRWTAAYALSLCGDSTAIAPLTTALGDQSPRVRMHAARALGALGSPRPAQLLSQVAHHDSDWRVRVNAARAVGNLPVSSLIDFLPLRDSNEHVRLASLAAIGLAGTRFEHLATGHERTVRSALLQRILSGMEHASWRERAAAALSLAQTVGGEAVAVLLPHARDPNPLFRARLSQAMGATRDRRAFAALQELAADSAMVVRLAALEALPAAAGLQNEPATSTYLQALDSGDEVLTAIAVQNLATDSLQRRRNLPKMIAAYRRLRAPVDVEVAQIIFKALALCGDTSAVPVLEDALRVPDRASAKAALEPLKMLTGRDYSDRLRLATVPHQQWTWENITHLSGLSATLRTSRGLIEIEFFPKEAPLTVLNFVRLAERDFFDGLLIHRVVPNFVIQTGDPRGDMWGSPGYTIRSEFSALRYTRGTVGMASAGPDTEGSQFFIVHSDQPRLDGRYTIFALVTDGMEVVDALQVGDVIEDVVIQRR